MQGEKKRTLSTFVVKLFFLWIFIEDMIMRRYEHYQTIQDMEYGKNYNTKDAGKIKKYNRINTRKKKKRKVNKYNKINTRTKSVYEKESG